MTPRLGAHMSVAGGMHRAVERAVQVQATALQVFVKSARQWSAPAISAEAARRFRADLVAAGLERHTLAHASYLINLASPSTAVRERSIRALRNEVGRCEHLGIPFLVFHPGAHLGIGEQAGLDRIVRGVDRALAPDVRGRPYGPSVQLLVETTAGQGTNLGYRFEQLGRILDRSRFSRRLGVCVDTCHVLAAGYDIRRPRGYSATFRELDAAVGLDRVRAFHLNDSRHGPGSRRDRHEHIGRGEVGLEAFGRIVNDSRFRQLPLVLETPKGEELTEDRRNLGVLRALVRGAR